eukprot:TRINITY_DN18857_c0_g1_i10.p1 TRINITY_DN18857_c0_g1~~TRINITY_DN18857_c0_g1_i10.p1  ORF type:complete len:206 (-),score=0.01 TRINITY_DN18857_c0_g1_i10:531-1148(-)
MTLYAAEIWGLTRFQVIESTHLFACKRFLRVSPKTPNLMVYGELGRYPLFVDSMLRVIRYWFKLQKLNLVRLPKQAYEMYRNKIIRNVENQIDKHNWVSTVRHCLDTYGFSDVWLNGGVGNEKAFIQVFKQRLIDCYMQEWSSKLYDSDRYSTYRCFKSLLQPEKYLSDITIITFRTVFVKFRLGLCDINTHKRYTEKNKLLSFL